MENDKYIYATFNGILPLTFNPSGMHMRISPNLFGQFRIQNKRGISFSRIINNSYGSLIITLLVHYE